MTEIRKVRTRWTMETRKTMMARRYVGSFLDLASEGVRGKKRRKRKSLHFHSFSTIFTTYFVRSNNVGALHNHETAPLHPNLRYTQHSGETLKAIQFSTAIEIAATGRKSQDIGKGTGAGCGAQEHEIW